MRRSGTLCPAPILRLDPATIAHRMGNSVQVLWNHYATWFKDLSPDAQVVLSDGLDDTPGRGRVGDASSSEEPLPWEIPAHGKRTMGLEPTTFGLGSRRSTN